MGCRLLTTVMLVLTMSPMLHAQSPTRLEQATVATLFGSSSISMVPVWITAACTTAETCHEVNPVMRKLIGDGPVRAVSVKAALSFGSHYAVWSMPATTKTQKAIRLSLALSLLTINAVDAANDIRVFRRLAQQRQ